MTCNHKDNYLEAIDGPCGYCERARAEAAEAKNAELEGELEDRIKITDTWNDLSNHLTERAKVAEQTLHDVVGETANKIMSTQEKIVELEGEMKRATQYFAETTQGWIERAEAAEQQVKELREALHSVHACFIGAECEGLLEKLQEADKAAGTLGDLVERRLMFADTYALEALTNTEQN